MVRVAIRSVSNRGLRFVSDDAAAFTQNVGAFFVAQATGPGPITITKTGSLPSGLTGADYGGGYYVLGGTPTGTGSSTVTLTATNLRGSSVQQTLTITVAAAPQSNVYLSPADVDMTGTTDVTSRLQSWSNSVPDGQTMTPNILRLRAGTYRVENIWWLRYRKNFVLDMSAATIIANTDGTGLDFPGNFDQRQRAQVIFTGCENFVVYEPTIRGANPVSNYKLDSIYVVDLELQHALRFAGCTDFEVSGGLLSRTYGDGIYLGYGQLTDRSHRLCERGWIHGTEVTTSGRQGLSPCGVSDCVFEDGYNHHNGRASFDFEPIGSPRGSDPDTFGVFNTHLIGWHFGPCRLSTIAHKGNGLTDTFVIKDCYGDALADCQFKSFWGSSDFNSGQGPGEQRYSLWFVNNSFPGTSSQRATGGGYGAIPIQRYTGVYFGGNNIPVQNRAYRQETVNGTPDPLFVTGREPLVQASYCTNVTVTGNTTGGAPELRTAWQYTSGTSIGATPPKIGRAHV